MKNQHPKTKELVKHNKTFIKVKQVKTLKVRKLKLLKIINKINREGRLLN